MAEEKDTPLFSQYQEIKSKHQDEVLFFRLGDFYEMFDTDAEEVSKLLNLTLTHRADKPMCGIPYRTAKIYIARLLRLGKKIAIAEQVGEIAKPGKGLTERKVIEVITPGTALESEYLDGGVNNFLASAFVKDSMVGFAYIDVTTGEFKATSFSKDRLDECFPKEISRCHPRELLLPKNLQSDSFISSFLQSQSNISISWYPDWNFNEKVCYEKLLSQFKTTTLASFSLNKDSPEVIPAGFLLDYMEKTTNTKSPHVRSISVYTDSQYLVIDGSSFRNLEILSNQRDGSIQFSLLECVNHTKTSMGSRLLREYLSFPLTKLDAIRKRQEKVDLFYKDRALLKRFRDFLDGILDIERLACRIAMDKAHAKDLQALRLSLENWLKAKDSLGSLNFSSADDGPANTIIDLIKRSLLDDPSTSLTEGGIIRPGWSEELDHWQQVSGNFNQILEEYLEEEKEKTGIQTLKIRKTNSAGYCLEVSKGKLGQVPSHFIMRRSLMNADRYTTQKLQELEENLNESGTRVLELERDLFVELRNQLKQYVHYLQNTASEIAFADVCSSFAQAAVLNGWVCPILEESLAFEVKEGRHPVVEKHLPSGEFVPNDLILSCQDDNARFSLITGPNMAGKSTFLRQNAIIALLAQTGSFVPAEYARLGLIDKIFCRVGASDNLAQGESTFLVEMTETARILRSATEKSLVIMDEVGRGTSTEDGLAIAWAVSEYLLDRIKCKTLFATHYHELTRLDHPFVKKLCMAVSENDGEIVFLRKVISGCAENSYGIHVASLAGVPEAVLSRAESILEKIQKDKGEETFAKIESIHEPSEKKVSISKKESKKEDFSFTGALFSDEELILDEILSTDLNNTTPMDALKMISRWKNSLSGR